MGPLVCQWRIAQFQNKEPYWIDKGRKRVYSEKYLAFVHLQINGHPIPISQSQPQKVTHLKVGLVLCVSPVLTQPVLTFCSTLSLALHALLVCYCEFAEFPLFP